MLPGVQRLDLSQVLRTVVTKARIQQVQVIQGGRSVEIVEGVSMNEHNE